MRDSSFSWRRRRSSSASPVVVAVASILGSIWVGFVEIAITVAEIKKQDEFSVTTDKELLTVLGVEVEFFLENTASVFLADGLDPACVDLKQKVVSGIDGETYLNLSHGSSASWSSFLCCHFD